MNTDTEITAAPAVHYLQDLLGNAAICGLNTISQLRAIVELSDGEEPTCPELGAALGIEHNNIAYLVTVLDQLGLLTRTKEGRTFRLKATEKGLQVGAFIIHGTPMPEAA